MIMRTTRLTSDDTRLPYTSLFQSNREAGGQRVGALARRAIDDTAGAPPRRQELRELPRPSRLRPHGEAQIGPVEGAQEDTRRGSEQLLRHVRSEEHTTELQTLMRISYRVFFLTQKKQI